MVSRLVVRLLMVGCIIALMCVSVSAGGPCRPPACGPVCAPPPPMCGPVPCGPIPAPMIACPPPQPMCGLPPCAPPACRDKENPLAKIAKGACMVVTGVVALPFKLVDCLVEGIKGDGKCPPPSMACAPAGCMPPPAPMCGPGFGPPGVGPGMGMPRPMGMGYGARKSKRFVPFAKEKPVSDKLLAGTPEGFFGAYW
jgi:hypothetical protein